ncbi:MAG: aminopeptidase N [Desulfobulbaceae bacterium]|jgi:aminopeptidase N|nr:aminopeptidase N [Desulfobulbaceae bacterium]
MTTSQPATIYLKDYQPPPFAIDGVDLHIDLHNQETLVTARLSMRRCAGTDLAAPLELDGEALILVDILLDDEVLDEHRYEVHRDGLRIFNLPDQFVLSCTTRLFPEKNTSLDGLYRSHGNYCTQCEAQGFRKITYYLDRPDVMALFSTTIEADMTLPVLLSNGNLTDKGELAGGRHFARWEDPHPKPCYLFAMVAGELTCIEDRFTTMGGRDVALKIYVEHHNRRCCDHAMASLKKAMAWDEERFGLEYDLDLYMIVAVDDFNMGAMENKGLNVFNSKYVLAEPATATDSDYEGIEAVIAHEYFHNWTGNRVTCRDWFQLSLKEGLTVFRDQEFSADMTSQGIQRINDVQALRNVQFPEDGGPMAHPVRPESYIEINNFYTVTVYEKGAEVIRMIHTMLGPERFRRGMDIYFQRHDGQAVTCEDFVAAMEAGSNIDLSQFKLWYSQAGTPVVKGSGVYHPESNQYELTLQQSCPATPGQEVKQPLHFPVKVMLYAEDGSPFDLDVEGVADVGTLAMREATEFFVFQNIATPPLVSLLCGFSAPVKLQFDYTDAELQFLLTHDQDPFNRWEAAQRLGCRVLLGLVADIQVGRELALAEPFIQAYGKLLESDLDPALLARILMLPTEKYVGEQMDVVDVDSIYLARTFARKTLAQTLFSSFQAVLQRHVATAPYQYDPAKSGDRLLKNICLAYLMVTEDPEIKKLCLLQFEQADNMTDTMAALTAFVHGPDCPERQAVLADFYSQWSKNSLVLDKWFAIQATAPLACTLTEVKALMAHPAFSMHNPNKVRALIGAFCGGNDVCFHHENGEGYEFLVDQVIALNGLNPQIAARLVGPLSRWRRFNAARQILMKKGLQRILDSPDLSKDVYEMASKSLV